MATALTKQTGATLKDFLESPAVRAKLAEVASAALKPEDLIRMTLVASSRSPDLLKCSRESILRALLDAAALGIQPGGLLGRGYLIPRANRKTNVVECCFDPGVRGLIDIARRSGQVKRIEAHVVHERDSFVVERTPLTTIRHVPSEADDPGPIRAAYAVAEFTGGELQIEIVWQRDLAKIRKLGSNAGPWASWPDEMSKKTAIRRLCKYLPYDPMLERAMAASDTADAMSFEVDADGEESGEKVPQAKRLAARLAKGAPGTKGVDRSAKTVPAPPSELAPAHDPKTGEISDVDEYPDGTADSGP